MDFRKAGLALILAGVIVIAASFLMPRQSELSVTKVIEGDEAVRMVESIHIGKFDVESAAIVEFNGGEMRVWIARANSTDLARVLTEKMAENVGKFFSSPEKVSVGGLDTYRVYGNGRVHYFFSFENAVVWVEFESRDEEYHMQVIKRLFLEGEMEKYIN
ncbi:hypothetical protein GAH_01630 [Geoglobus ahangari]|uniref:Uncharacterized protein n=1 Tax=Geoglobus ahangari TaxID=113653 RepID=A0A0F7ICR3_9EURY|nr:hypothetical protein [Geoglobus ahangari]AKG91083.1 hypothetical protein GAH_01630 [Geoglobus ahangari]